MRYLKTYKIFESFTFHGWSYEDLENKGILGDIDIIKDRLIDLDDNEFEIVSSYSHYHNFITVRIERPPGRFFIYEVLGDIKSLVSHMDDRYTLDVKINFNDKYYPLNKIIGKTHLEQLHYLSSNPVRGITLEFHRRKAERKKK